MTRILKIRVSEVNASHLKVKVFMGKEGETLKNLGELVFSNRDSDYGLFGTALGIGSGRMQGHLVVEFEEELHKEWERKGGKEK